MIKVGLIGDGIDKILLQQYPVRMNRFIDIDEQGTLRAELRTDQLSTWVNQDVEPNIESETTDNTKVISILLQAMTAYDDVTFDIAKVPMFPGESTMDALSTALGWMAEQAKPDFVYVGFSRQEGKYQKKQDKWIQELHRQGCKIIGPAGVPPAFPAQLNHVISVADTAFMEAGFDFSNPDVIVEDKSVVLYTKGAWVRRAISNETASALVLSKMIRDRITSSPHDSDNPVILPNLKELTFSENHLSNNGQHEFPDPPKPKFTQKVRWYLRSMASRVIMPTGRVPLSIKATRKLSCNGDGKSIAACPFRVNSKRQPESFICGACGCGDGKDVFVDGSVPKFEKLDYPYIHCPASMPGFSNYLPSKDECDPHYRKLAIETKLGMEALAQESHIQRDLNKQLQKRLGWLDKI